MAISQESSETLNRKNQSDIKKWIGKSKRILSIQQLPGDASTRKYFRIESKPMDMILMKMEPFSKEGMDLPFLAVQRHLSECNVDVPLVYDIDPAKGFILLEDLGDQTLLHRLENVSSVSVERQLYQQAIDALAKLHKNAMPENAKRQLPSFGLSFDFEKLMWEVRFTIEHFYEKHLQRKISVKDLKIMHDGFGKICKTLASEPTVFTHRDFHSRNIMIAPGSKTTSPERMVMIDFQDARMGPAQYDLASLLRDSYYQLGESQVEHLIEYYLKRVGAGKTKASVAEFTRVFDLMAVQRNFKAIGSFASFLNNRGIATYLKYVGNTFENIRRALLKYPEYSKLREVLFHYYYF